MSEMTLVAAEKLLAVNIEEIIRLRAELTQERERANLLNIVLVDANELHAEVRAELTEVRASWLSPAEAEGLRGQLAKAEDEAKQLQAWIDDFHSALLGMHKVLDEYQAEASTANVQTRIARLGQHLEEAEIATDEAEHAYWKIYSRLAVVKVGRDFWRKRSCALERRRDAAEGEQALQNERQLWQDAELAAHVHDKACGELAQTVHTERRLRQEAEQGRRGALIMALNRAIQLEQNKHKLRQQQHKLEIAERRAEGALATARKRATRMGEAERRANKAINQLSRDGERAERAEIELNETSRNLSRMVELNEWSRNELDRMNKRADRLEALAALVNEETASLLERLAGEANLQYERAGDAGDSRTEWAVQLHADYKAAHALAASIRKAMEASDGVN